MRRASSSLALLVALLVSCSSGTVQKEEPAAYARARDLNNRAARLYAAGDYAQAASDFREAAKIGRSLDDPRITGLNSINLASSLRASGNLDEADGLLTRMIGEPHMGYSSADLASAHALLAALRMDMGRSQDASASASKAISLCSEASRCTFIPSARLALSKFAFDAGRTDDAEAHAAAALADARAASNPLDEANALRMLARCRAARAEYRAALQLLEGALAIDKEAGAATKVALDLYEIALTHKLAGDTLNTELYLRRALSSSLASGISALALEIENQLKSATE